MMKAQYGGGTITTCNTQNQSKYPHMKIFKNLAYHNRHIQKFHAKLPKNLGKVEIHNFIFFNPKKNTQYKHCVYIHLIALLPIA